MVYLCLLLYLWKLWWTHQIGWRLAARYHWGTESEKGLESDWLWRKNQADAARSVTVNRHLFLRIKMYFQCIWKSPPSPDRGFTGISLSCRWAINRYFGGKLNIQIPHWQPPLIQHHRKTTLQNIRVLYLWSTSYYIQLCFHFSLIGGISHDPLGFYILWFSNKMSHTAGEWVMCVLCYKWQENQLNKICLGK